MLKTILRSCITILFPLFAAAQKADFRLYTTADGLPQNWAHRVAQDTQGFLWVNLVGKLARFDGSQFRSSTNSSHPAFRSNRPFFSEMDTDGKMLLFIENGQFTQLNTLTGQETAEPLSKYLPPSADTLAAQCIRLDGRHVVITTGRKNLGEVFILWLEHGKIGQRSTFLGVNTANDFFMRNVASDGQGQFFFINKAVDDVLVFDKNGKKLRALGMPLPGHSLTVLVQCQRQRPLLVVNQRIFQWNAQQQAFEPHPINRFTQSFNFPLDNVLEMPDGNIWASAFNRHLFFYDAKHDQFYSYQSELEKTIPHSVSLGALYADREGNVWVVTTDGLLKATPQATLFDHYFTEQNQHCNGFCSFRGFAEDDAGNVYASFYNDIFKINKDGSTDGQSLLPNAVNVPFDLFYNNGKLLLNDGRVLDLAKKALGNPYNSILNTIDGGLFAEDGNGKIWRTKADDFFELDEAKSPPQWRKVQGPPGLVYQSDIAYDAHNQQLWFFSGFDLYTLDPVKKTFADWSKSAPKVNSVRNCLYPDGLGRLWIGTEHGLVRFDYETKTAKTYTQQDGLPNETIVGLLPEGDSCLWISTFNGLSRLSIASGRFLNFFKEDGLADNEFNRVSFFKASDGRMFFGGVKGVTAFYPQEVMTNYARQNPNARLALRAVSMTEDGSDSLLTQVFNDPAQRLDIFHRNRMVTFEFGVFSDGKNGQARYSYQLDGLQETWSPPSQHNSVTFSSLPAGHYVFRVKALDARGNWLAQEIAQPLTVHPPWWAAWWAYLLYALLLMGAAYAVFLFLKKRWELQNQLKYEQQEAQRLKELDAFKSRLYTNITHEFRTPLTVILGMASEGKLEIEKLGNLKTGTPGSFTAISNFLISKFQFIERNGQNLLRLVNQLLDLSKLEDESFQLKPRHGDIVPFLRYVTESFQSYANGRNLSLRFFTTLEKLEMDFDPEQVQQVMTNLIGNAVKFTPSGGEIRVEIRKFGNWEIAAPSISQFPNFKFQISVSDTGIGIPEAELPHIFDRFYQVDGSATRAGEGTGIGLAHTLELVKLMGGEIAVESQLRKGTTFTVRLPITLNGATGMSNDSGMRDEESGMNQRTRPPFMPHPSPLIPESSLLLIEDNADVVEYLKAILSENYAVEVAYNGRIGVEMALENLPDLIVSDVMMPEKDGYQVLDTLKNNELTSHIPIVLLTAKADAESKVAGLRRGADAYLSKPFDKKELLATLAMMLENRRRMVAHFAAQKTGTLPYPDEAIAVEDAFMQRVRQVVANNYEDDNFALPQLCDQIGMSRSQLFRKMKALTDTSPSDFIRDYRMQQARQLLETRQFSVKEVAYKVGFKDLSHFSKTFQEVFGVVPSSFYK